MEKLFKDPIHNNIRMAADICKDFVDTELFQRLRFIEQSTMRTLFPSARHDRFIHSLGVYWLAHKLFCHLEDKLRGMVKSENCLTRMRSTFLVAALLHDCAHSPFSHTGEELAQFCNDDINLGLCKIINSDAFSRDYKMDGKTHEVASAYVACKRFCSEFEIHFVDREQFARMIIGCQNTNVDDPKAVAYNVLISLINGFVLDVDRLDYMLRDTWATGISNATVDVDTLIAGFDIDEDGKVIMRGKALSGMLNAIYARDYIRRWIVSHHKVVFYNMVLPKAMNALMDVFKHKHETLLKCQGSEGDVGKETLNVEEIRKIVFSPDRLLEKKKIGDEFVYLPTDGDVLYWMKKYIPDNKYVCAYLSRKNEYRSIWKNLPDFVRLFKVKESLAANGSFWQEVHGRFRSYIKEQKLDAFVSKPFAIANDERIDTVCVKVADYLNISNGRQRKRTDFMLKDVMDSHRQKNRYVIYFYLKRDVSDDKTLKASCKVIKDLKAVFAEAVREFSRTYQSCL